MTSDTVQAGGSWNPHGIEIIHRCPASGEYLMPCCGQAPLEVPRWHPLTRDPEMVTCQGSGER